MNTFAAQSLLQLRYTTLMFAVLCFCWNDILNSVCHFKGNLQVLSEWLPITATGSTSVSPKVNFKVRSCIVQMFHLILDQFISHLKMANCTYPLLLTISLMPFAIPKLTINTFGNTKP